MIDGPVRATDEDLDAMVELADICFSPDMRTRWPHCYTLEPGRMHYFVMKEDGRPVSLVAYADQTVQVEGRNVRVAGITAVCTHPDHRGRGHMSGLLDFCIQDMTNRGYALSELGGDRRRYRNYGWDCGSREWQFQISRRSLRDISPEGLSGFSISRYRPEDVEALVALYDRAPYGTIRTKPVHELVFGRVGWETWVCRWNGNITAYLNAHPARNTVRIDEYGGDYDGIVALLLHLLQSPDRDALTLCSPWDHPFNPNFFDISARWHVATPRMVRIIDLEQTLRGFSNQIARRYRETGLEGSRSVVLGIKGTGRHAEVRFSPEAVAVSPTEQGADAVVLSEDAMVRFLFCPGGTATAATLPGDLRFLDALLPLDFYLWPLERV